MASGFYGTYACLFIGFSKDLSQYVVDSALKKSTKQTSVLGITYLDGDQVSQALNDPRNKDLKTFVGTAYKDFIETNHLLLQGQESVRDKKTYLEEALGALDEKRRISSGTAQTTVNDAISSLNTEYKQLNNIDNAYEYNDKQLDTIGDFSSVISTMRDDRDQYNEQKLQELYEAITKVLRDSGIQDLPSGEVDNLLRPDAYVEVYNRFMDTGANKELPADEIERILHLNNPTFETYYKLKAYLAIRSVYFARENMGQIMRRLDTVLAKTKEEGEKLAQKQEPNINAIAEKIKPITDNINSNNTTVDNLAKKREDVLKNVGDVVRDIEQRFQTRISEAERVEPKKIQPT